MIASVGPGVPRFLWRPPWSGIVCGSPRPPRRRAWSKGSGGRTHCTGLPTQASAAPIWGGPATRPPQRRADLEATRASGESALPRVLPALLGDRGGPPLHLPPVQSGRGVPAEPGAVTLRTLATLRTTLFACGAILGADGRQPMLRLSSANPWQATFLAYLQRTLPPPANCNTVPAIAANV